MNSRTHSDEQVGQIMASMLQFGWTNPVLADGAGLVAGHGRVMAAIRLYAQGETLRLMGGESIPGGMVPVIDCTGWSTVQRKAYIIADNRLAENAGWDSAMLALQINDLRGLGFDFGFAGFDADELAEILEQPAKIKHVTKKLEAKKYLRILISVPVDSAIYAKSILNDLAKIESIEIDYGGN